METECVSMALEQLIEDTVAMVGPAVADKGLALLVRIAPEVPRNLVGDPLRIGQMLLNLANNAVKFTEQGSIAVAVERVEARQSEVVLRFSVTDTGIGLTPEQQEKLFVPFQQADDSITRKFGGTGLGLSLVKQLADLMDGRVGVESKPGEGSCFWFILPLRIAEDGAMARQSILETLVPLDPALLRGARVLLVEDDSVSRSAALFQVTTLPLASTLMMATLVDWVKDWRRPTVARNSDSARFLSLMSVPRPTR